MCAQVLFEPIDERIECDEEEAVLDAAFRQGFNLVYGCREGQCSACKAYVLEGEVALKRHSSFALSESEESQGYTLLCRAMPDTDLVIELLHYDPDDYRMENPIRDGRGTVEAVEALTHDIRRLVISVEEPEGFEFKPGQYVDVWVPGTDERRSFSLANLPGDGTLELVVKRYPEGLFSGLLDGGIEVGQELRFTGPYGSFYLRDADGPALLVAGGSGMAPVVGVLREMAERRVTRPVRFLYGARARRDVFWSELIGELGSRLDDFAFVPVLSEPQTEDGWEGETGLVHEAADAVLRDVGGADGAHAYLCGPPPMVDAAIEMLTDGHGLDEGRIFYDKFTTAATTGGTE